MRKVFNNKDLIQLIVEHISNPRDFRSFRLVSRKILEVSKKKSLVRIEGYTYEGVARYGTASILSSVYFKSKLSGKPHGLEVARRKNGNISNVIIWKHGHPVHQVETREEGNIGLFRYERTIRRSITFMFNKKGFSKETLIVEIKTKCGSSWRSFQYVNGEWIKWPN